ncbi:hypothetical protein SKAU_G00290380 [Synaphobranchus kaupii]|uniref:Uncharacterized protein n=1 Tax=Synaphobranchus kaupii TaxID=118154 RepID=A0A9Q1IK42_SYNKA|nr:hypothetical protein SKAU_G00290380 [Synaphobranchus kaupii]
MEQRAALDEECPPERNRTPGPWGVLTNHDCPLEEKCPMGKLYRVTDLPLSNPKHGCSPQDLKSFSKGKHSGMLGKVAMCRNGVDIPFQGGDEALVRVLGDSCVHGRVSLSCSGPASVTSRACRRCVLQVRPCSSSQRRHTSNAVDPRCGSCRRRLDELVVSGVKWTAGSFVAPVC